MVSLALLENAEVTVSEVFDAIADTVLVSPVTVISSPTTTSVKNNVPTPGTVVLAAGSIVPVSVKTLDLVSFIYNPNSSALFPALTTLVLTRQLY